MVFLKIVDNKGKEIEFEDLTITEIKRLQKEIHRLSIIMDKRYVELLNISMNL